MLDDLCCVCSVLVLDDMCCVCVCSVLVLDDLCCVCVVFLCWTICVVYVVLYYLHYVVHVVFLRWTICVEHVVFLCWTICVVYAMSLCWTICVVCVVLYYLHYVVHAVFWRSTLSDVACSVQGLDIWTVLCIQSYWVGLSVDTVIRGWISGQCCAHRVIGVDSLSIQGSGVGYLDGVVHTVLLGWTLCRYRVRGWTACYTVTH